MTESDWLTSTDPTAMLGWLNPYNARVGKITDPDTSHLWTPRKLRLWAVACCRQVWPLLTDSALCGHCGCGGKLGMSTHGEDCAPCDGTGRVNRSRRAVEVAERYADGAATEQELVEAAGNAYDAMSKMALYEFGPEAAAAEAFALCRVDIREGIEVGILTDPRGDQQAQAALLREVCGNPRRPVMLPCAEYLRYDGIEIRSTPILSRHAYAVPPVLALARSAHEERVDVPCERCDGLKYVQTADGSGEGCHDCHGSGVAFHGALDPGTLAVLSDELEIAGCTDEFLLSHLRGLELIPDGEMPNKYRWQRLRTPHVRGCWAVDAVLGKEAVG